MKKNGLKLFETKLTTLTHGVRIIKVEPGDNAQLDLLTAILEKALTEEWTIAAVSSIPPLMIYTLVKYPDDEKDY